MNSRRHALALAGVLTATVLTGAFAVAGIVHHPRRQHRSGAGRPDRSAAGGRAGLAPGRTTDAPRLGNRRQRLGDARDRRGARLDAPAAGRGRSASPPRPRCSSRARTARRSAWSCSAARRAAAPHATTQTSPPPVP